MDQSGATRTELLARRIQIALGQQGGNDTLDLAWDLLEPFSAPELKRIHADTIAARRADEGDPSRARNLAATPIVSVPEDPGSDS